METLKLHTQKVCAAPDFESSICQICKFLHYFKSDVNSWSKPSFPEWLKNDELHPYCGALGTYFDGVRSSCVHFRVVLLVAGGE